MFITRFARLLLVSFITLSAVITPQAAFAGQTVDPSTLNPPVPPEFNPECKAVGDGTICTVSFTQTEGPEGTGIICGSAPNSFEVVGSDIRTVEGRRYYDRNGDLTQRHFREVLVGTFTNPLTGASLDFVQADTIVHDLAVPGDLSTGTETSAGSTRLSMPHGGVVLIDAGRSVIAVSDGTILFEAGQHPFDAYFVFGQTSALQPVCDALS
jgi:hypothetical protein